MTHHGSPANLLAMVPAVGEPPRRVHLVSIPASDLDMGLEMSASTRAAAQAAVEHIVGLLSAAE